MTISMAFIAPDLVKAAIDGHPAPWHQQGQFARRTGRVVEPTETTWIVAGRSGAEPFG